MPLGALQNDLISGEGGIVSAEPAVRLQRMARLAAPDPALVECLVSGPSEQAAAAASSHPGVGPEYRGYLDKFGDRTSTSSSWKARRSSTTRHRSCARSGHWRGNRPPPAPPPSPRSPPGIGSAPTPRTRVARAFRAHPFRRVVFNWVLRHARRRVKDRENLRLERTRLFGRVRRIFLELGQRLRADGVLDDARDVFYLEVDEVLAFVEGRATTTDLRGLAALRQREFAGFQRADPARRAVRDPRHGVPRARVSPDRRPRCRGGRRTAWSRAAVPASCAAGSRWCSIPVPASASARILVAEHTDPGWIMIFPSASALIVERGSLLSHAAIVARELGIPAVVSVPGVTRWLADGDEVEVDGSSGVVRRITPAKEGARGAE